MLLSPWEQFWQYLTPGTYTYVCPSKSVSQSVID